MKGTSTGIRHTAIGYIIQVGERLKNKRPPLLCKTLLGDIKFPSYGSGDEVRYGMEFSVEEPHGLTCHQHTVAHDSTDGTLGEIRRITGMRKVNGVQEFCVA